MMVLTMHVLILYIKVWQWYALDLMQLACVMNGS